jgi:hypothetical protein
MAPKLNGAFELVANAADFGLDAPNSGVELGKLSTVVEFGRFGAAVELWAPNVNVGLVAPSAVVELGKLNAAVEPDVPGVVVELGAPDAVVVLGRPNAVVELGRPNAGAELPAPNAGAELPTPNAGAESPSPEANNFDSTSDLPKVKDGASVVPAGFTAPKSKARGFADEFSVTLADDSSGMVLKDNFGGSALGGSKLINGFVVPGVDGGTSNVKTGFVLSTSGLALIVPKSNINLGFTSSTTGVGMEGTVTGIVKENDGFSTTVPKEDFLIGSSTSFGISNFTPCDSCRDCLICS